MREGTTEYTEFHRGENFNPCLKTSFNADYADYRRLKSMFFRVIRIWKMHHRVHRVSQRGVGARFVCIVYTP